MKCPFKIKVCSRCKRILVAYNGNFNKNKDGKYGLRNQCKLCCSQYAKKYHKENSDEINKRKKQYYEENKEEIIERNIKHYEENKEKVKKKRKQYYQDNKDEINKKHKQYYEDNKETILKNAKEYRETHKEKIKEYYKQYVGDNPEYEFNKGNKRRKKTEKQGKGITKEQWIEMMEFFNWKCAYSGKILERNRTIDHIISLNKGGLNEPWNCVPMLKSYNSSKYNKDMITWYKQQEFFDIDRLMKIYEWQEYAYEKWGKDNN